MDSEPASPVAQSIWQSVTDDGHGGWGYAHHIGRSLCDFRGAETLVSQRETYQPSKDKTVEPDRHRLTGLEVASTQRRPIDAIPSFSLEPPAELKLATRSMTVGPVYKDQHSHSIASSSAIARSEAKTPVSIARPVAASSQQSLRQVKAVLPNDDTGMSLDELNRYMPYFKQPERWPHYLRIIKTLGGEQAYDLCCALACEQLGVSLEDFFRTWDSTPSGDVAQARKRLQYLTQESVPTQAITEAKAATTNPPTPASQTTIPTVPSRPGLTIGSPEYRVSGQETVQAIPSSGVVINSPIDYRRLPPASVSGYVSVFMANNDFHRILQLVEADEHRREQRRSRYQQTRTTVKPRESPYTRPVQMVLLSYTPAVV